MQPNDQISLFYEYGLFLNSSGDIYYGVPMHVFAKSLVLSKTFAIPKSPSLILSFLRNILWVFKSLCKIFLSCK